ncbi:MAG: Phenylacetic acid catabolic protein [Gemmatimonadota bacterium]
MTRDLILILADSKRLLGTRYAEWILGAPELEAGIACASMAQDEWGHGRLLYALLKDFGDDPEQLEHGREPNEYRNMEVLDRAPQSWPELIVLNALVDSALTVQLAALRESDHTPLRQRIGKVLDEEIFHAQHGDAWLKRLASGSPDVRDAVAQAAQAALPAVLRWFGENQTGDALREQYLQRVGPLLTPLAVNAPAFSFEHFDAGTRRTTGASPDADTIRRVRGDKNRQFLMD